VDGTGGSGPLLVVGMLFTRWNSGEVVNGVEREAERLPWSDKADVATLRRLGS
jgi:hypothetical protein